MEEKTNYLVHHGVKGQRWGVRRYQNPDGSLTQEGKNRLAYYKKGEQEKLNKKYDKRIARLDTKIKNRKQEGKDTFKVVNKRALLTGRKAIEERALKKMTYDDYMNERIEVGKDVAISALVTLSPIPVIWLPDVSGAKERSRSFQTGEYMVKNKETKEWKKEKMW